MLERNRSGSISVGLPCALAPHEPADAASPAPTAPTAMSSADELAALLPHQDAEHDAAHADDRQHRADRRRRSRGPVYGTSRTSLMPESTTAITTASSTNATRHDR